MARHKLNLIVRGLALGALVSQPVLAGGGPTPPQLYVTSVHLDFDAQVMVIQGENFDNGKTPVVTLGETLAPTSSHTATTILALLPAAIEDGDYLMTVSTGNGVKNFDAYDLTLGAVGRKGDKPAHEWSGTAVRFENPDGSWGDSVDLKGEQGDQGLQGEKPAHEWSDTALRFENPDGSWGSSVDLEGPQGPQGNVGPQGPPGAANLSVVYPDAGGVNAFVVQASKGEESRSIEMLDASNSVCFLVGFRVKEVDVDDEIAGCEILRGASGKSYLRALRLREGGDHFVRCEARCLTW